MGLSFNGRTSGFHSDNLGSIPGSPIPGTVRWWDMATGSLSLWLGTRKS